MKALTLSQLALAAIVAGIAAHFADVNAGLSAFYGGSLMALNFLALTLAWPRLLKKKSVALPTALIVFKFAIFGWILYLAVRMPWFRLGWFALGMALVVPTVVAAAVLLNAQISKKADT